MNGEPRARNSAGSKPVWEHLQRLLTPFDWPAALAERLGASTQVALRYERLETAYSLGTATSLRVAFASDFHAGPMTSDRVLDHAVEVLAAANPDLLLLGGDFVSIRARYVDRVTDRLAAIRARAGKFAVLGNHDYWAEPATVTRALERAGIEVLINANRRLSPPFDQVTVCGLDDDIAGSPDAVSAFQDATQVRLVIMHSPSGLLDIAEQPFTMAFAGHTHGGQVALRSGYPLYVPHGRLSRRYFGGRFDLPLERVLLVSRGIGCSSVPIRWNVPAEVHLCELHHAGT
jgi:predicted MPP superfamily phosphohydrolase